MQKSKCIVLTGGGTAGHVMPNLALLEDLHPYFDRIVYAGQTGGVEENLAAKAGLPFVGTQAIKFDRTRPWRNMAIPKVLRTATRQMQSYLEEADAQIVFSKGGYCSLPAVLAAHRLRIPIVCHESDYSLGLANKVALWYTPHLLTAFDTIPKGQCVGNPLRRQLWQGNADRVPRFVVPRPCVLVVGGSSGAKALNELTVAAMPYLQGFNVLLLYGKSPVDYTADNLVAKSYADNIADYYAAADVVVCRSGSNTLFELAALGKRVITIPLPKGNSRGDQEQNAAYFARKYDMTVLEQRLIDGKDLAQAIKDKWHSPKPRVSPAEQDGVRQTIAKYLWENAKDRSEQVDKKM